MGEEREEGGGGVKSPWVFVANLRNILWSYRVPQIIFEACVSWVMIGQTNWLFYICFDNSKYLGLGSATILYSAPTGKIKNLSPPGQIPEYAPELKYRYTKMWQCLKNIMQNKMSSRKLQKIQTKSIFSILLWT